MKKIIAFILSFLLMFIGGVNVFAYDDEDYIANEEYNDWEDEEINAVPIEQVIADEEDPEEPDQTDEPEDPEEPEQPDEPEEPEEPDDDIILSPPQTTLPIATTTTATTTTTVTTTTTTPAITQTEATTSSTTTSATSTSSQTTTRRTTTNDAELALVMGDVDDSSGSGMSGGNFGTFLVVALTVMIGGAIGIVPFLFKYYHKKRIYRY